MLQTVSKNVGISKKIWKYAKNCEKKEIDNETFSCHKYGNIQRKKFNDINKLVISIFKLKIRENKIFV